jgi:uncharacterized OB-fold protein
MTNVSAPGAASGTCPGDAVFRIQGGSFSQVDPNGDVHLIGSECGDCGQRMFPARARCPSCFGDQLHEYHFGSLGTVVSFTVVRQAPPGYHGAVPYVLGMVELGDGTQVLTHLVDREPQAWKAGDRVESCAIALGLAADAPPCGQSFAFRPTTRS